MDASALRLYQAQGQPLRSGLYVGIEIFQGRVPRRQTSGRSWRPQATWSALRQVGALRFGMSIVAGHLLSSPYLDLPAPLPARLLGVHLGTPGSDQCRLSQHAPRLCDFFLEVVGEVFSTGRICLQACVGSLTLELPSRMRAQRPMYALLGRMLSAVQVERRHAATNEP